MNTPNEINEITTEEAFKIVGNDTLFIDLREDFEFADKSINVINVFNFPFSTFEKNFQKIPKDKKIILICLTGIQSQKAYEFLLKQRYKMVYVLLGGIIHWAMEGHPMKSNPDSLPEDIFDSHCCNCKGQTPDILE